MSHYTVDEYHSPQDQQYHQQVEQQDIHQYNQHDPQQGIQLQYDKAGLEVVQNDPPEVQMSDTPKYSVYPQSDETQINKGAAEPKRRRTLWIVSGGLILVVVALVVVAGVLGSRLATKNNATDDAATTSAGGSNASSSSSSSHVTSAATATVPSVASITSFTSYVTYSATTWPVEQEPAMATLSVGGVETLIDCPYSNNTVYVDPTTETKFLRRCGVNPTGHDTLNVTSSSLADCMAHCASVRAAAGSADVCSAAVWTWGWSGNDPNAPLWNTCYLKSSLWDSGDSYVGYNAWGVELAVVIS